MALLEGPILGTGSANHIVNTPGVSPGKGAHLEMPGRTGHCPLFQSTMQFHRNIRQVFHPRNAV
jgi:hypothetical protein